MRSPPTTPYAVLGMLRLEPQSGYSIRKGLAAAGAFWSESYGQIYPALRDLVRRGWARRVGLTGRRGAGALRRHRYAITLKGEEALRRWLATPPRRTPPRNELLLKIYFGDRDSVDAPAAWVRSLLTDEFARLRRVRRLMEALPRSPHRHRSIRHWLLALEHVERQAEATVAWCQRTIAVLDLMQEASARRRAAAQSRSPME